jgi:hypothetical protein
MSKWINKEKANLFIKKKKTEENDVKDSFVGGNFAKKYPNPEKGTQTKAKEYKIRFIPDPEGEFYLEYFYHFVTVGEKSRYILCEKTFGNEKFCPLCAATNKLYKGNSDDKAKAGDIRKKQRFVGNIYVVDDPRDSSQDDDDKLNGSVRLYEFPSTVELKVKDEIKDEEEGRGIEVFDPENGYDFIVKVFSKPPDKRGKIWPDYSSSKFSVKSSSIPNVEEVMSQVYDLKAYLERLRTPLSDHKKVLEELMIFEDIEDDYNKYVNNVDTKKAALDEMDEIFPESTGKDGIQEEPVSQEEETPVNNVEQNDGGSEEEDDILKELHEMMK